MDVSKAQRASLIWENSEILDKLQRGDFDAKLSNSDPIKVELRISEKVLSCTLDVYFFKTCCKI